MEHPRRGRFGPAPEVVRAAVRDPDLRRLQAAWLAANAGKWAFLVTSLVVAFEVGGAVAVGILSLVRFLVPTVIAPFAGWPAARWRPERVLVATNALRVVAVALIIPLIAIDGPILGLYLLVALEAAAGAFNRPVHIAMLPALARTPGELVSANVASSAAEGIGTFVGPALGGVLLATTGPLGAYLAVLGIYALGVAAIAPLSVPQVAAEPIGLSAIGNQALLGARTAFSLPGPRLIMVAVTAQTTVRGVLIVLTVAAAIELLAMGDAGVGLLNAAMGAGGFVGAVGALTLAGSTRLAPWFVVALAGWGLPIVVIGLLVHPAIALAAMVAIGVSNAVFDVALFTLLQRVIPNRARVAVLGLVDTLANGGQAVGGIVAPLLIALLGIEGALIATGLILPIVAVLLWPGLRHLDREAVVPAERLSRIRSVPLFAPLSLTILEHLAGRLVPVRFAAGDWLMREGEHGDRYYLIDTGTVAISQGGTVISEDGPGTGVGEIALLRDVPRTASVQAVGEVETLALERADFLEAITGHPVSRSTADELVTTRLERSSTLPD
jgi:hypothetical protein